MKQFRGSSFYGQFMLECKYIGIYVKVKINTQVYVLPGNELSAIVCTVYQLSTCRPIYEYVYSVHSRYCRRIRFPIIRLKVTALRRFKIKASFHCVCLQVARCTGKLHNGNLSGCQACALAYTLRLQGVAETMLTICETSFELLPFIETAL